MANPSVDIAASIVGGGLAGITAGNTLSGLIRDANDYVPINALFIGGDAGPQPLRVMGEDKEIRTAIVHIRVRWNSFGPGDGKVRLLQEFLQKVAIAGYLDVTAMQSEPVPLGSDGNGNFLWIMSYMMVYEDAS